MRNLFSIPIFFIVFRESLEAAIIVSVLLGLVEQIVKPDGLSHPQPGLENTSTAPSTPAEEKTPSDSPASTSPTPLEADPLENKKLVKKLRWQIFAGALIGLLTALAIGAAFIAVWFTQAADLWARSEDLWEGIFSLIAAILIFVMGITMLKMDRAKAKWRIKLQRAFDGRNVDSRTRTSKWALFILPFVTVLREGMEAVVFVGGVSLGQPATSIPIAAIVGIICGLVVGWIIYVFASRSGLSLFLIVMTNFLLLIGAGLFSKSVGFFEFHAFNKLLGAEVDDAGGDGPGSYQVHGNVWHIPCCNPENNLDGQGWSIFAALFGWTNNGTLGTVLSYVFYWIAVIVVLVWMKWREGRVRIFGYESRVGRNRRVRRQEKAAGVAADASGGARAVESEGV